MWRFSEICIKAVQVSLKMLSCVFNRVWNVKSIIKPCGGETLTTFTCAQYSAYWAHPGYSQSRATALNKPLFGCFLVSVSISFRQHRKNNVSSSFHRFFRCAHVYKSPKILVNTAILFGLLLTGIRAESGNAYRGKVLTWVTVLLEYRNTPFKNQNVVCM